MKTRTSISGTVLFGVSFLASQLTFADTTVTSAGAKAIAGSEAHPGVQYALTITKAAAAPAEAGSENLLGTADDATKATEVAHELAILGNGSGSASATRALVVPREEAGAKSVSETEEDLTVMAHLLDKAVSSRDGKSVHAMGISVYGMAGTSIPRSLYLEGYGALFFLNVNYPLVPPPAKKEKDESKDDTNTEWENARRELFHPSTFTTDWSQFYTLDDSNGAFAFSSGGRPEEYDADKVEDLKKNLIGALKNASHIRQLKPDETVTVIVTGRAAPENKGTIRRASTARTSTWITSRAGRSEAKVSRLVVRAKKSDVEAFQKDKLSLEDFQKHVTLMIY